MTEEYRQVEEFDNYFVSNYGNIKNKHSGIILSRHDCRGVLRVNLCKDGKKYNRYIHRLVASAFLENLDGKEYVVHIDKNRHRNEVTNLKWISKENWIKSNPVASVLSTLENRNSQLLRRIICECGKDYAYGKRKSHCFSKTHQEFQNQISTVVDSS